MKDWYLLRGVEYSTNFNFFVENQIFMGNKTKMKVDFNLTEYEKKGYKIDKNMSLNHETGKKVVSSNTVDVRSVCSRLESYNFGEILNTNDDKETEQLQVIHTKLLKGGFGDGRFID